VLEEHYEEIKSKIDVESINHSNTLTGLKRKDEVRSWRGRTCDL